MVCELRVCFVDRPYHKVIVTTDDSRLVLGRTRKALNFEHESNVSSSTFGNFIPVKQIEHSLAAGPANDFQVYRDNSEKRKKLTDPILGVIDG